MASVQNGVPSHRSAPKHSSTTESQERVEIKVIAMHDFEQPGDKLKMSFKVGDVIQVTHQHPSGWWRGYMIRKASAEDKSKYLTYKAAPRGWFPASFVKEIRDSRYSQNLNDGVSKSHAPDSLRINIPQPLQQANSSSSQNSPYVDQDHIKSSKNSLYGSPSGAREGHYFDIINLYNDDPIRQQASHPSSTPGNLSAKSGERDEDDEILDNLTKTLAEAKLQAETTILSLKSPPEESDVDLPYNWGRRIAFDGREYFCNLITNETVWNKDDIPEFEAGKRKSQIMQDMMSLTITNFDSIDQVSKKAHSWEKHQMIVKNAVALLLQAAKQGDKSKYVEHCREVVLSIRTMLFDCGAVDESSEVLTNNPPLLMYFKQMISELGNMVISVKAASAVWPVPDSLSTMTSKVKLVYLYFNKFQTLAADLSLPLKTQEKAVRKSRTSSTSTFKKRLEGLSDVEIASNMDSSFKSIRSLIEKATARLQNNYLTGITSAGDKISGFTGEMVRKIGDMISFLDDVRLDYMNAEIYAQLTDKQLLDIRQEVDEYRMNRNTLNNEVTGILSAINMTTGGFAPPNSEEILKNNLAMICRTAQDLVVSAKILLSEKQYLESSILQDASGKDLTDREKSRISMNVLETVLIKSSDRKSFVPISEEHNTGDFQFADSALIENQAVKSKKLEKFFGEKISEEIPVKSVGKTSANKLRQFFGANPISISTDLSQKDYLDPDYRPQDLLFSLSSSNKIKAGTVEALVEYLTSHNNLDMEFNNSFLRTFHLILTPEKFLSLLKARFEINPPKGIKSDQLREWKERKQQIIRQRVQEVLKKWVEAYWFQQSDHSVLQPIKAFVKKTVMPSMPNDYERLLEICTRRTNVLRDPLSASAVLHPQITVIAQSLHEVHDTLNSIHGDEAFKPFEVREFSAEDIAKQLTLIEFHYLSLIHSMDLFKYAKTSSKKKKTDISCASVRNSIAHSNAVTSWVAETILNESDIKIRVAIMRHFIRVADKCHAYNNYGTRESILAAFQSTPIYRLKKTWELMPSKTKSVFEALTKFMDRENNFLTYRQTLKNANPPCIPFIGLHLTDITFIDQGNPDNLDEGRLINFYKFNRLANVVDEIERLRLGVYKIPANIDLIKKLQMQFQKATDIQNLHDLSLKIEPKSPV